MFKMLLNISSIPGIDAYNTSKFERLSCWSHTSGFPLSGILRANFEFLMLVPFLLIT